MSARHTRFYLDKENAKFLGVCAGIADYTGLSRFWVRIGFVVVTLLGAFPWTVLAYFVTAWAADSKPREFADLDPDETRFWQGVRASPGRTVRDVRASFRDIDRRLADIEAHVTSSGQRLAREIDGLRQAVTDALGGAIAIEAGSVVLTIRVTPKASKSAIGAFLALPGGGRALAMRIAAPPVDGAANAALIALLAKSLAVRRSDIHIVVGEGARLKRVRIDGDGPAIAERLMTKVAAA